MGKSTIATHNVLLMIAAVSTMEGAIAYTIEAYNLDRSVCVHRKV